MGLEADSALAVLELLDCHWLTIFFIRPFFPVIKKALLGFLLVSTREYNGVDNDSEGQHYVSSVYSLTETTQPPVNRSYPLTMDNLDSPTHAYLMWKPEFQRNPMVAQGAHAET